MPNSFQQPITPGSRSSYEHGENYGSGPGGLPIRRMMREGSPSGYEIQFQDEWMPMDQFNDPTFQQAFFQPWQAQQRQGSIDDLRGEYAGDPGAMRALGSFSRFGRGRRGGGRVGSSGGRGGGGGYSMDPQMMALLGG